MVEKTPTEHTHGTLDYNEILDGIFIGTNQCCQAHFDERLRQEGITADVSLEQDRVDQPFGVAFYIWLPVKDKAAPTKEQLTFGAAVLEELTRLGQKVYVHCKNGHGRAPTLVAAYLIRQGRSVQQAIDLVSQKRDGVHIEDVQRAALEEYASSLEQSSCCP